MKLDEGNFILWQQHIKLIVEGYELTGYLNGTLPTSSRFVLNSEGQLVLNLEASLYHQQDKLLASWLLSTIGASLISCFMNAKTACDVWTTANWLFAAITGANLSSLKHELHLIKKGTLTVKEYFSKIQNTCALIAASGYQIQTPRKLRSFLQGCHRNMMRLSLWHLFLLSLCRCVNSQIFYLSLGLASNGWCWSPRTRST